MRSFTFIKTSGKSLLLVLFFALLSINVFAEGTPTVAPNNAKITALLSVPDLNAGPYFNAAEDNRVKFTITNNLTQNFYFGLDVFGYVNILSNSGLSTILNYKSSSGSFWSINFILSKSQF
jgi:hypothetical protein